MGSANEHADLRELLTSGGIRTVYQPIVELQSREPVAYEALARGPAGSRFEAPGALFNAAAAAGLVNEVDAACRSAALEGALRPARTEPFTLFVNVEPDALDGSPLFDEQQQERILRDRVRVVVELDEDALTASPADMLAGAAWLRNRGLGVALDGVGADRRSLALLPFIRPDIVKLGIGLVHQPPNGHTASVASAVGAHAERSGAQVLAVGIETEEHLRRAIGLGATLGQGWLFGRPEDLPEAPARRAVLRARRRPSGELVATPFKIVSRGAETARISKAALVQRSLQIEAQAAELGPDAVLLTTFEASRWLGAGTRTRYELIARRASFVGAFAAELPDEPAPGVHGCAVDPASPLASEWNVLVVSPHFACALVARAAGDESGPDVSRDFDYALTYDRDAVVGAARSLMSKVEPQPAPAVDGAPWLGSVQSEPSRT